MTHRNKFVKLFCHSSLDANEIKTIDAESARNWDRPVSARGSLRWGQSRFCSANFTFPSVFSGLPRERLLNFLISLDDRRTEFPKGRDALLVPAVSGVEGAIRIDVTTFAVGG